MGVCTFVCRWQPGEPFPVQALALRDELTSRAFDLPGAWWPDQPDLIGGRDRRAGGTWCVSSVTAGTTAVVLNRPERRIAGSGAPSRGVLPLLAARWGDDWVAHVELAGMASFNLVLLSPDSLRWWSFDGARLRAQSVLAGTHMFTPSGRLGPELENPFVKGQAELPLAGPLHLTRSWSEVPAGLAPTARVWPDWLAVLERTRPSTDPRQLLVKTQVGDASYETVFGQLIAARPGLLRLDYLDHPARNPSGNWVRGLWPPPDAGSASSEGGPGGATHRVIKA